MFHRATVVHSPSQGDKPEETVKRRWNSDRAASSSRRAQLLTSTLLRIGLPVTPTRHIAYCRTSRLQLVKCTYSTVPQDSELGARWFHRTNLKWLVFIFFPEDHNRSTVEQSANGPFVATASFPAGITTGNMPGHSFVMIGNKVYSIEARCGQQMTRACAHVIGICR